MPQVFLLRYVYAFAGVCICEGDVCVTGLPVGHRCCGTGVLRGPGGTRCDWLPVFASAYK